MEGEKDKLLSKILNFLENLVVKHMSSKMCIENTNRLLSLIKMCIQLKLAN